MLFVILENTCEKRRRDWTIPIAFDKCRGQNRTYTKEFKARRPIHNPSSLCLANNKTPHRIFTMYDEKLAPSDGNDIKTIHTPIQGAMKWTVALEGGPQRVNHAAVPVGDKIYSFGGYCTGENYQNKRNMDVHLLNTVTFRWRKIEVEQGRNVVPFQRYGHTAVAFGHLVYVWGGRNDNTACNILHCFDTNTHLWSVPAVTGTIPEARDGHSACLINDHMFIFSGYLEYLQAYTQDLHALNLRSMTWRFVRTTGTPPVYRDFHTAIGLDKIMYVWGGREVASGWYNSPANEQYQSDLHSFDTTTNQWEVVACTGDIPIGRRSHSAFEYSDHMYIFGGYNSQEKRHFNDLHRFNPKTLHWEEVKTLGAGPCPRRRQSCCVVGTKMFLFGGTSPKENCEETIQTEENDMFEEMTDRTLKDHNDLHVLDFEPSLKTLCLLKVQTLKLLDTSWLPRELKALLEVMSLPNNITKETQQETTTLQPPQIVYL